MGGGPRTFPGGVTAWQWKRMLAKKKWDRDNIWLRKEREIYEKRRRSQALSLMPIRPWEKIPSWAPSLPVVDHDPKIREMANRFQLHQGIDLWKREDGPEKISQATGNLGTSNSVEYTNSRENVEGQNQMSRFSGRKFPVSTIKPAGEPRVADSGSLLANYFRKQGNITGLEFPSVDEDERDKGVSDSGSSQKVYQRTDFSTWMRALEEDEKDSTYRPKCWQRSKFKDEN